MGELLKYNSYELRDIKIEEYINSYRLLKGIRPSLLQLSRIAELSIKEIDIKIQEMNDKVYI